MKASLFFSSFTYSALLFSALFLFLFSEQGSVPLSAPPILPSAAFEGMELEDYRLSLLPFFPVAWDAVLLTSPSL